MLTVVALAGVTAILVAFGGGVPLHTGPAASLAIAGCYLSPIRGELTLDAAGGMTFDAPYGRGPVVWPFGYTARRAGAQVTVRNAQGEIVARTGESVELWVGPPGDGGRYVVCG
jgi:hypothetical protein